MARKKLKQPSDIKTNDEHKIIEKYPHLDLDCSVFAKEHYGLYLIVKNHDKKDKSRKHNRLYLDSQKELEFLLKTGFGSPSITSENYKVGKKHLFSNHNKHKKLIDILTSKIERNSNRTTVENIIYGIDTLINVLEDYNKSIPDHPSNFNAEIHQKFLTDVILTGKITSETQLKNLSRSWVFIRKFFNNNAIGAIPRYISAQTKIEQSVQEENENTSLDEEKGNRDDISLEVLFQLDYYSQIELDRIIGRSKEYKRWMKELEIHGNLFSQANLLKTYFDYTGSWSLVRKLYILLYEKDPQCWNPYAQSGLKFNDRFYDNKADAERHRELIAISKNGINISVNNEKMFAWWHKTLLPEWPFKRTIAEPYNMVIKDARVWINKQTAKAGISPYDLHERIFPNVNTAYVMYLRLLIDTSMNTDTLSNIEVLKKEDGNYIVGTRHSNLRMFDSVKLRNNTVPPSFIVKDTFIDKCVDFYTEWLTPIYEHSDSKIFLQYAGKKGIYHIDSNKVKQLNPKLPDRSKHISTERSFFERYKIYNSIEKSTNKQDNNNSTDLKKNRLWWIKHKNIRAANNFKNYHLLYGEWVRTHVSLAHKNDQTEKRYYRNFSWKLGEEHQIATSLLHIQKFIEGKVMDKQLENVFEQPHCACTDNSNPTFTNAPKINDGEVCTSWRHCLTRCENSYIFPEHHGPTIMAWKIVMEQERQSFIRIEDWAKEYRENYEAVEAVIKNFKREDLEFAKSKAAERMPFVRLMMMQTKQKRKLNQIREREVNG